MSVADVGAILDCLERAHIDAWLDCGWGVDARLIASFDRTPPKVASGLGRRTKRKPG